MNGSFAAAGLPRRCRHNHGESGQAFVLLLIVLAVLAGGWWMLKSSRDKREKEAWAFANEAATHIVLQQDIRFMDRMLSPQAKLLYPPSWRMRLLDRIREPGAPIPQVHMTGKVYFTSQFFDPMGDFRAEIQFPTGPAYLDMKISHPQSLWQIDGLNWTWTPPAPPPTPAPTPTPILSPSPSASPPPR